MSATRLVLVEGLPGSGKTSMSRSIADELRRRGIDCQWHVEEARDHPVTSREIRAMHRRGDYDAICLDQWRHFVSVADSRIHVLDGCALQSTVRFMFGEAWPAPRIHEYWLSFHEIVRPLAPRFVYLRHPDARKFVAGHTRTVRSEVWDRISAYVEQTPTGAALGASGSDTTVEFWARYGLLCDDLVSTMPTIGLTLDLSGGWGGLADRVVSWVAGPEPT